MYLLNGHLICEFNRGCIFFLILVKNKNQNKKNDIIHRGLLLTILLFSGVYCITVLVPMMLFLGMLSCVEVIICLHVVLF